jgi:D-beta-D-heptose 7-phosphate kinase/D-beta-D-heptose 1-phosphate adenosyltransferase
MDYKELQDKYSKLSVLVCGDMCLDKDFIGGYSGFSREVDQLPIFRTEIEKYSPGGGGNLAVCFSALGVRTVIAGIWGIQCDINRNILESSFNRKKIDTSGMIDGSRTPTFGKIYLHSGVHVYRIDLISKPIAEWQIERLVEKVKTIIDSVDFIACADYEEVNKYGVCSEKVIDVIRENPKPRFATSRNNIRRFRDFHYLIGNEKEITDQVDGLNALQVIMTLGKKGAIVYRPESMGIKVESQELSGIIDPCGCGDMFYASYASSIMAGYDVETSLRIANSAARVVARKLFGTGQSSPEEIVEEFETLYSQ